MAALPAGFESGAASFFFWHWAILSDDAGMAKPPRGNEPEKANCAFGDSITIALDGPIFDGVVKAVTDMSGGKRRCQVSFDGDRRKATVAEWQVVK
jgi:hypothetical protein